MSNYPTSIDDDSTLYTPANSFSTLPLLTTLAASCLSTDTDIQITASVGMIGAPTSYGIVSIDDEMILYTGHSEVGSVYKITGCVRGFGGTTAIGHASGVSARWRYVADFDLALQVALIAVQNTLGITGAFNFVEAPLAALVNKQTGTSYTILDGDRGKLITGTNASSQAYSIAQAGSGGGFANGWFVDIENRGAGTLTITPSTSTIDGAASLALTANQGVRLFSDGSNYFTQRGVAGGSGSVTTVSVVSANGLAGSVSNPTTTPAITLSTTITGLLKGNGTAISAAAAGTDYATATNGTSGQALTSNGSGGFGTALGVVTTVGTPGSDSNIPTEQGVREAIDAAVVTLPLAVLNIASGTTPFTTSGSGAQSLGNVAHSIAAPLVFRYTAYGVANLNSGDNIVFTAELFGNSITIGTLSGALFGVDYPFQLTVELGIYDDSGTKKFYCKFNFLSPWTATNYDVQGPFTCSAGGVGVSANPSSGSSVVTRATYTIERM